MKNLFLLPTDKPSRLHNKNGELGNYPSTKLYIEDFKGNQHNSFHIYITSDEEITVGYYLDLADNSIIKVTLKDLIKFKSYDNLQFKKIILTTDQSLDGIQAIDDTFLQWFVKNPSCEEVEIKKNNPILRDGADKRMYHYWRLYKIIIPKEEPKQETLEEYLQICKDCGSEEVARCKWVNVNTEKIYSADSGTNLEWCFDCKSETNIIDKEDYETKIQ